MQKVLVQVSDCCGASVLLGMKPEFPLGGRTWHISYRVHVCEKCLKETDPVDIEICEECGEETCECAAIARMEVI